MRRTLLLISIIASQMTIAALATEDVTVLNDQLTKLNRSIQENDKDRTLFEERASCLISLLKFKEAVEDCNKAIALDEQDLRAYHLRSLAFKGMGNLESAKADQEKVALLASELSTKNADKEIADSSEQIKKTPNDAKGYVNRASAYLNCKDYQNAIADATTAIRLDAKNKAAYLTRMGAYMAMHRNAEAAADRASFNRIDSSDEHHFSVDAVSEYTHILNINGKDRNALQNRAQAYFDLGKNIEAIADLTALIKLDPTNAPAFRLRAQCYKKLNDTARTQADFKQANALEKNNQY
jgi:tetratricopeptide (TPR) repeat protein